MKQPRRRRHGRLTKLRRYRELQNLYRGWLHNLSLRP